MRAMGAGQEAAWVLLEVSSHPSPPRTEGFPGCRTPSAQTGKALGRPNQLVTFAARSWHNAEQAPCPLPLSEWHPGMGAWDGGPSETQKEPYPPEVQQEEEQLPPVGVQWMAQAHMLTPSFPAVWLRQDAKNINFLYCKMAWELTS